jgi:hypothetical protein
VEHQTLGEPAKLSTYNTAEICNECQDAARAAESELVPVPPEHEELLRAARALLDNGIENEDEIIPTLVLAANVGQMPRLEYIRDELAKAGRDSKARAELDGQLYSVSGGWIMSSGRVVDGVPLVRRALLRITGFKDKGGHIEEIAIDVFKRSVTHEEVGKWYEWYLKQENLDYDLNDLSRGVVAYKTDNREFFRLIARPEERSVDTDGRILPITEGIRKFPHPPAVAGMYKGLRGLMAFAEPNTLLSGRLRGPDFKPHNLVPACVAWYLGGRRALIRRPEMIPQVAKMLNQHLLAPCGKGPLPDPSPVWRDTEKVDAALLRFEGAIRGGSTC